MAHIPEVDGVEYQNGLDAFLAVPSTLYQVTHGGRVLAFRHGVAVDVAPEDWAVIRPTLRQVQPDQRDKFAETWITA